VIHDAVQGVPDQIGPDGSVRHNLPAINLPAIYDGPPPTGAGGPTMAHPEPSVHVREEYLGSQSINGVIAQGSRTTTTIPVGQIGNDRPIDIVSERWYSTELQMNIKTVESDPRYDEITYQLTDIHQGDQDAALFRHPTSAHPQR
jgi:hypothetical protein